MNQLFPSSRSVPHRIQAIDLSQIPSTPPAPSALSTISATDGFLSKDQEIKLSVKYPFEWRMYNLGLSGCLSNQFKQDLYSASQQRILQVWQSHRQELIRSRDALETQVTAANTRYMHALDEYRRAEREGREFDIAEANKRARDMYANRRRATITKDNYRIAVSYAEEIISNIEHSERLEGPESMQMIEDHLTRLKNLGYDRSKFALSPTETAQGIAEMAPKMSSQVDMLQQIQLRRIPEQMVGGGTVNASDYDRDLLFDLHRCRNEALGKNEPFHEPGLGTATAAGPGRTRAGPVKEEEPPVPSTGAAALVSAGDDDGGGGGDDEDEGGALLPMPPDTQIDLLKVTDKNGKGGAGGGGGGSGFKSSESPNETDPMKPKMPRSRKPEL